MKPEEIAARVRVLRQIRDHDGADGHRTIGKAPVMNDGAWRALRGLEVEGLVSLDLSSRPIMPFGGRQAVLGVGFVSLTDDGRALLAKATTP